MSELYGYVGLFAGCIAGASAVLFGIGGGVFIVPVLMIMGDVPPHVAIATSLIVVVANSLTASIGNIRKGYLATDVAIRLEPISAIGGFLGGLLTLHLPTEVFQGGFALLLLWLAGRMIWRYVTPLTAAKMAFSRPPIRRELGDHSVSISRRLMAMTGGAGVLSGAMGVGGGIVLVPLIHTVEKLSFNQSAAISAYVMGLSASAASVVSWGKADPLLAAVAICGVYLGSLLGQWLRPRVNEKYLAMTLAAMMFYVALRLLEHLWTGM